MTSADDHSIPPELQDREMVIVAWCDANGHVLSCNKGLESLLRRKILPDAKENISELFINPSFAELQTRLDTPPHEYKGLITLGLPHEDSRSFQAQVLQKDDRLYVLAEYDKADFERFYDSILDLNNALSQLQRALLRKQRDLEKTISLRTQDLRESLDKSERLAADQENIMNSVLSAILTINEKGIILSANQSTANVFGYSPEELIDRNVRCLMPDPDASSHDQYIQNYLTTGVAKIIGSSREVTGRRKDGSLFPLQLSIAELSSTDTEQRRFVGSCLDLSERKQQEEIIRRTEKMNALGKLTSGISHDMNNMLGLVQGYAELIMNMADSETKIASYADHILHSVQRGANLTRKLLAFSKNNEPSARSLNVNDALREMTVMLQQSLTPRIQLRYHLSNYISHTSINPDDFEDAILNLCINASHAINGPGEVQIETVERSLSDIEAKKLGLDEGAYIQLSVEDNGCGMDQETLEHIFDPFFTTKDEKGTGLGLSQIYAFVKRSKGAITVSSEKDSGSRFSIYLPVDQVELVQEDIPLPKPSPVSTTQRSILVVDDETDLASMILQTLDNNGFEVCLASTVAKALDLLKSKKFDLVLTDIVMPEMSGFQLACIVRDQYPNVKIQLMSGYVAVDESTDEQDLVLLDNLLSKPFSSAQLLEKIQEALLD